MERTPDGRYRNPGRAAWAGGAVLWALWNRLFLR